MRFPVPEKECEKKVVKTQSGITFSAICEECNNKLGGDYDKALIDFAESVKLLSSTTLHLPQYPSIQARPTAIIKSVFGHMLATKTTEYPSVLDDEMRRFLRDDSALLSDKLHLFYWFYQYDVPVAAMNRTAYEDGQTCLFSVLKLYPLSFLLLYDKKMTDDRFVEITKFNHNDLADIVNIPFRRFDVEQDFPEGSRFSHYTFVVGDSTRFIAFPKEDR